MRCKQGDLAIILRSITGKNVGMIVNVAEYIGHFNANEQFVYNGIRCQVPITDNYWWITTNSPTGFDTPYGPTHKAYGPDTWMQPIRPDLLDDDEETGDEVYNILEEELCRS